MNCSGFTKLLGMRCEPMPTRDGSEVIAVVSPFTFSDGDGIEMYAETVGSSVRLFDDGMTMYHLRSVGIKLDSKRWQPLRNAIAPYKVCLTDDGIFETWAPAADAQSGFARYVSALLAIAAWEREHEGLPASAHWLQDEAALYLQAWKPHTQIVARPDPLAGFSGKMRKFDFLVGDEYVDTLLPHGNTTGSELRKILDVRGNPFNRDRPIRVIVDDRRNPSAAKEEIAILGRVATAWTMTGLMAASLHASNTKQ